MIVVGVISCDCCGSGVLEIKCPYSCKQKDLIMVAEDDSGFFICDLILENRPSCHIWYFEKYRF